MMKTLFPPKNKKIENFIICYVMYIYVYDLNL